MAKASAKPKNAPVSGARRGSIGRNLGFVIILAPLLFIFLPTAIFLAFTLLPTFVALVVDRTPRKYLGMTVGGLNIAGTAPYLLDLWLGEHSVTNALTILSSSLAWVVIMGAAAMGWLVYMATPTLVASVITMTASYRLQGLKTKQKQLIEDWGTEVSVSDAPSDAEMGSRDRD